MLLFRANGRGYTTAVYETSRPNPTPRPKAKPIRSIISDPINHRLSRTQCVATIVYSVE